MIFLELGNNYVKGIEMKNHLYNHSSLQNSDLNQVLHDLFRYFNIVLMNQLVQYYLEQM